MEVISSVNLAQYEIQELKEIFSTDHKVQLKFDSKAQYDALMKSAKADIIHSNKGKIVSVRGPLISSSGCSLFEDTALIVSHLEDNFDISLQYLTTLPLEDGKHIAELSDFFQDTVNVFVSTLPFVADTKFRTPFGIAEHIKDIYSSEFGYDKMSYLGMSYNAFELNNIWLDAEICYSFIDLIDEIHISVEASHSCNWVEIINYLSQTKAMGKEAYVTFDTGKLDINSWRTFRKVLEEV